MRGVWCEGGCGVKVGVAYQGSRYYIGLLSGRSGEVGT